MLFILSSRFDIKNRVGWIAFLPMCRLRISCRGNGPGSLYRFYIGPESEAAGVLDPKMFTA